MLMKLRLLLVLVLSSLFVAPVIAQDLWSDADAARAKPYTNARSANLPSTYRLIQLNRSLAATLQQRAPLEKPQARTGISNVQFPIPLPDGSILKTSITESPILSPELQVQLTTVKTYELTDPVTHTLQGRITITPEGITGLLFTATGSVYISPLGKDYPDLHMVYYVKDVPVTSPLLCGVKETLDNGQRGSSVLAGDCQLRTYRLAVVASGGYTYWAGGQANALTYMTTLVNDISAIYERDVTIRLNLVSNNSIIFTDSTTDPYPTVAFPTSGTGSSTLELNQSTLNSTIGSANFDLGIVLNYGWNGGLARLSAVCNNSSKGMAAAGLNFGTGSNPLPGPQGPVFTGTVAHEIGHLFSATHSFAANNGGCAGNTTAASAWEPGGGSTIMAYAGTCTGNFYQFNSDLYFHGGNILQISNFALSTTCPVTSALSNVAPTVSVAASAYTIPISTPFRLDATASDANGNTLYHCWEQMDAGLVTSLSPQATNTTGPNFRSYPPTTNSYRIFPALNYIINGTGFAYEVLPSVSRTMTFQDMVRDQAAGGGCTAQTSVAVTTNASAGPFVVTSQNTATNWTANGTNTATITWNVANTNAAPVNCTAVDILFSTDGGNTFPYTLASNTANDGSEIIIIPSLPTAVGRIMIRSRNNIFFNINTAFINCTSACTASGGTITPSASVSGAVNTAALNLTLSPAYGTPITTITGQLATSDAAGTSVSNNVSAGNCVSLGLSCYYDTYSFVPNTSGNYTFTLGSNNGTLLNLYSNSFNPALPCANFINSSGTLNGSTVTTSSSVTASLIAGASYVLVVSSFNTAVPALPSNYTITPSGAGTLYTGTVNPGAGFNYAYVVVNNSTGNIKSITTTANLSNGTTYPVGTYTVYGLSYSNTVTPAVLNGYIGSPFTSLQNALMYNSASVCGNLSTNAVQVTVTAALPAQLLPLKAYKVGNTAELRWGTASEQNTGHFEIWRSANGSSFDQLVGSVPASGNSNVVVNYQFTDNNPLPDWNYYRIKEVDLDGNTILSNIARVNMSQPGVTLSVYPNPVNTKLTLEYITDKRENIQVRILDSKGSLIRQSSFVAQQGSNIRTLPVSALAKGVYVLQVIGGQQPVTTRFIKE